MATKAKLEGNARYLAKFKTVTIRFHPEELSAVKAAAAKATGGSVQGYILQAVREKMQREQEVNQGE
ncbi:MAG: RNA 3'-terminal phosphate cyclase [Oscillospiraceae bacterium]|nr:RNA 3'-terminal phosphate cyclase [Oscillospiraceae bacterium]